MEGNRKRRRQRRRDEAKASKLAKTTIEEPPVGGATSSTTLLDIPDHVLELILLGLDSPVCLVRAASACKRWCGVVADDEFLGRFRRLRLPRLVMGHYHNYLNLVCFVPSPTATPPPSTHISHSVSLDFVPQGSSWGSWVIVNSRNGLLLLTNKHRDELVVCEPQTRRYKAISMPGKLSGRSHQYLGLLLHNSGATSTAGGELGIGMSNFEVMVVLLKKHMVDRGRGVPEACVYRRSKYRKWRDVGCAWMGGDINIPYRPASFHFAGRANGSLYWAIEGASTALVLHEATAGVALEALPVAIQHWSEPRCFRVVGREDGTLRAVRLADNDLSVFARLKGAGDDNVDEWVLEHLLRLPEDIHGDLGHAVIVAAHETYVLVAPRHSTWVFSVDLKTMAVERVRQRSKYYYEGSAYPYELPWPPILNA